MPRKEKPNGTHAGPVVVDTHFWIEFFTGRGRAENEEVKTLIRSERVALVGPILFELLRGARTEGERQFLLGSLRAFNLLPTTDPVWLKASELARIPAVIAKEVPGSDILIAAHCQVYRVALFSLDPHFDAFPNLPRHRF